MSILAGTEFFRAGHDRGTAGQITLTVQAKFGVTPFGEGFTKWL